MRGASSCNRNAVQNPVNKTVFRKNLSGGGRRGYGSFRNTGTRTHSSNDRSSLRKRAGYYLAAVPRQVWQGLRVRRADVVLSMGLPLTTLAVAWLMSLRHRAPFAVDVRDMPFEMAGELGYVKSRRFLAVLRAVEGFLLRRARVVVTNSPRYKPMLVDKGVQEDRITVAPIGYDAMTEPEAADIAAWREKLVAALGPDTRCIGVYTGTLGYAFPVEELLEGAARLGGDPAYGFVFVGDGQRLEEFRDFAEQHNVRAFFTGRVPKTDVMAICRAADYCLYPSNLGAFSAAILGNKVFDYLGAKKPVIHVGGNSAVRDVIEDLGAGLHVDAGQPDAFAKAVRGLHEQPGLAARLSAGAAGYEDRGYTAKKSAQRLAALMGGLIRARR